jgi:hypothetical protein
MSPSNASEALDPEASLPFLVESVRVGGRSRGLSPP